MYCFFSRSSSENCLTEPSIRRMASVSFSLISSRYSLSSRSVAFITGIFGGIGIKCDRKFRSIHSVFRTFWNVVPSGNLTGRLVFGCPSWPSAFIYLVQFWSRNYFSMAKAVGLSFCKGYILQAKSRVHKKERSF